jgi:hypothetical protein
MKKLTILFLLLTIAVFTVSAQKRLSDKPKYVAWATNPVVHPVPPEHASEQAIYLNHDISLDYRVEGRSLYTFYTEHRLIKVLDEKGIESFSTITIPVSRGVRVPSIKARTISPNGKVHDIAKSMILVSKDDHGRNVIKIAMEGVVKNAEIELLMEQIWPSSYYGTFDFQYTFPVAESRFSIVCPKHLVFEVKSYNGFPKGWDKVENNRRQIEIVASDIPALREEPFSFYGLHRMSVEYRMKNNINNTEVAKFNTWDDFGRMLYDNNYKISQKEKAAVNRFLSELGVQPNGKELENIRKIEDGIKQKIVLYDYVGYEERKQTFATNSMKSVSLYSVGYDETKDPLDSIISNRAATPAGYVKLFTACFVQARLNHQVGMAYDRTEYRFNKNFENWNAMDYYLFYFPNQKKFLAPTAIYLRYPFINTELVGGKGVFCNIQPSGVVTSTLHVVRPLTPFATKETYANVTAGITLTKDFEAQTDIVYSYGGYMASPMRKNIALAPKDRVKDIVKEVVTIAGQPANIIKYSISNEGFENYYSNKPVEVYASVNTPGLVDKAGANYLFKIGKVLGPQAELYSETERFLPVHLGYPYSQKRTITVNIPKGYKVLNANVLRTNADYLDENQNTVISFNSDYTIQSDKVKGDKLVVTVTEFYSQLQFPVAEYNYFRKVVNAAADFSKVSLLIGKKGVIL